MSQSKPNAHTVLEKWYDWLAKLLTWLSALTVAALVLLMVVSSLMRYVVGSPFHFTEEMSALFFMTLSILPIAYVARLKNHIRIGVIIDHIPQPTRDWVALAGHIISLVFVVVIIKITWDFAYMTHELGGRSPDAGIVLFPWMALIPFCFVVYGVQVIIDLIKQWQSIMSKR